MGGAVGYCMVDFKEILVGIRHSYKRTIGWKPNKLYWRAVWWSYVALIMFVSIVYLVILLFLSGITVWFYAFGLVKVDEMVSLSLFFSYVIPGTFLFSTFVIIFFEPNRLSRDGKTDEEYEKYLNVRILQERDFMRKCNPVMALVYIVRCIIAGAIISPQIAVAAGLKIAVACWTLGAFIKGVFIYIHYYLRVLCFVDSAIGATIGYFYGDTVIGAIAGAIIGAANYELVSVRWLKIVPARSKTN